MGKGLYSSGCWLLIILYGTYDFRSAYYYWRECTLPFRSPRLSSSVSWTLEWNNALWLSSPPGWTGQIKNWQSGHTRKARPSTTIWDFHGPLAPVAPNAHTWDYSKFDIMMGLQAERQISPVSRCHSKHLNSPVRCWGVMCTLKQLAQIPMVSEYPWIKQCNVALMLVCVTS